MQLKRARRGALLAALSMVAAACSAPGSSSDGKTTLVFASYGGPIGAAEKKAYIEAYEKSHPNIKIVYDSTADAAKIKAMVESGNVSWDVVAVGGDYGLTSNDTKYLEKIDCTVVACSDLQPDKYPTTGYRVPIQVSGTALGYNTSKMPSGRKPQTWADFFDTKKFPGQRISMDAATSYTLEAALMASGVPKDQVYPLDVDRALREWDKIKSDVTFTSNHQQCVESLATGDAAMGLCWTGRLHDVHKNGAPVAVQWNGAPLTGGFAVVPKGSKHVKEAMDFTAFITSPKVQADFANLYPYGSSTKKSEPMIKPEMKPWIGSIHADEVVFVDNKWWAANRDRLTKVWQSWLTR